MKQDLEKLISLHDLDVIIGKDARIVTGRCTQGAESTQRDILLQYQQAFSEHVHTACRSLRKCGSTRSAGKVFRMPHQIAYCDVFFT
jgi:hypothetical protein